MPPLKSLLPFGLYAGFAWFCLERAEVFGRTLSAVLLGLGLAVLIAMALTFSNPRLAMPGGYLVGLVAVVGLYFLLMHPSKEELARDGTPLVTALEAWAVAHGRYPASLEQAALSRPWTRYGRWKYEARGDGAACRLSLGDEALDGFELGWSSETGAWTVRP